MISRRDTASQRKNALSDRNPENQGRIGVAYSQIELDPGQIQNEPGGT